MQTWIRLYEPMHVHQAGLRSCGRSGAACSRSPHNEQLEVADEPSLHGAAVATLVQCALAAQFGPLGWLPVKVGAEVEEGPASARCCWAQSQIGYGAPSARVNIPLIP